MSTSGCRAWNGGCNRWWKARASIRIPRPAISWRRRWAQNATKRDQLRQYITDLATQNEQEFAVVDREAQRCRDDQNGRLRVRRRRRRREIPRRSRSHGIVSETTTFACSICEEPSTEICVYCTKDVCDNHRCREMPAMQRLLPVRAETDARLAAIAELWRYCGPWRLERVSAAVRTAAVPGGAAT